MEEYTGWKVWEPTDEELAELYQNGTSSVVLKENEYLMVKDKTDGTICSIYKKKNGKLEKINRAAIKIKDPKDGRVNKTYVPRNPEQACAFDMLHDTDTTVKLITGRFGSGKTLMLVTAALEGLREKRFDKVVWIRNNIDVKDTTPLGSLPGTAEEKLWPYLGPFIDHVGDKGKVLKMIEMGQLDIQPLQFLRGRNIERSVIICTESQNMTADHLALIIARAAEGTEVWFDGDFKQYDRTAFERSKGLEKLVNRLSDNKLFGYVKLIKTERSATAALADLLDDCNRG